MAKKKSDAVKDIHSLGDMKFDDHNANKGTAKGKKLVGESIGEYGAGRSIVADKNGKVIGGNKTLQAAIDAGMDVEVIRSSGEKLIVHQRADLDLDEGDKARLLAYADNRSSEVGLDWDVDVLSGDIAAGIDLSGMFDDKTLEGLGVDMGEPEEPPEAKMDAAEALQEKWQVKDGDVWQIGAHRLMCGDSSSEEFVSSLMAGANPNLMVTDPPYGVNYDPSWRESLGPVLGTGKVKNDDCADWTEAWKLFGGNVAYVWHAGIFSKIVCQSIEDAGFEASYLLIWNKNRAPMGRGHYHHKHEPCWFMKRKGAKADWIGDRKQNTVWDIDLPAKGNETTHGTQKPLECMLRPISNHAGDVYDPFLGSGTTMVASEQLGRKCYGIEIEPKYCAVILERMSDMGLTPELVENARG